MTKVLRVHELIEGQVTARINWRDLPDLDDLLLEIARDIEWEHQTWDDDEPTRISDTREAEFQWAKISPCFCGEHGWHWDERRVDPEKPLEEHPPRRFLALSWGW